MNPRSNAVSGASDDLESALAETLADLAAVRFVEESAEEHLARMMRMIQDEQAIPVNVGDHDAVY